MKYWHVNVIFCFVLLVITTNCSGEPKKEKGLIEDPIKETQYAYGISLSDYDVTFSSIDDGWTLSHMLAPYGITGNDVYEADILSRDTSVQLKYIVAGKSFAIFTPKNDTLNKAHYIVYESSIIDYIIFDFTDGVRVRKIEKPVTVERKALQGVIVKNSNLTETINSKTQQIMVTGELSEAIAGVFAWSIDFFKLQPGDEFKVIYQEKRVEETAFGIDRIEAIWFKHQGQPYYAFYFINDSLEKIEGYYDEEGKEMKRPFLMSPVKFSRISSGFSAQRFHPVQKRNKPHLGTDYAAPEGTPIFSTADGTVIEATRSQFNGNYVKVKHNETYTTQYLHMSRIGEGMRKGVRVRQGQTIGYVGSTGLATGPHVCYRFWKNGKQVDHRTEKLPTTIPLKKELLPLYKETIAPLKEELDAIQSDEYIPED